jgi:hypothetical protein
MQYALESQESSTQVVTVLLQCCYSVATVLLQVLLRCCYSVLTVLTVLHRQDPPDSCLVLFLPSFCSILALMSFHSCPDHIRICPVFSLTNPTLILILHYCPPDLDPFSY